MAAKFDKDAIIKHRFWILTGVFLVLALVALGMLFMSVSDAVAAKQKDYEAKKKLMDDLRDVKNDKWVAAYNVQDNLVAGKQNQVHRDAWMVQKDIVTWPEGLEAEFKDKYFGDDVDQFVADNYRGKYKSQLWKAVEIVQPLIPEKEDGVVQFNGSIDGVLRLSRTFPSLSPPSKEDIWLAQEDVWVKRELLRAIRDANDSVARFKPVGEDPPPVKEEKKEAKPAEPVKAAEGADQAADKPAEKKEAAPAAPPVQAKPKDLRHRKFRNQHWELDLKLTKHDDKGELLSGTITNISKGKQPLGVFFKILMQDLGADSAGVLFPVDREPLGAGETWTIPPVIVPSQQIAVEGIMGVEQVLTWKTAPVKRIDWVELYYHSSRTANRTLKPPRWYKSADSADPSAPAGGTEPGMSTGGTGTSDSGGPGGSMMMGSGTGGSALTSKNGLLINRYTDANEQVRHMPVAVVLIVDEDHVPEVLSAFANAKLRVQITQVHWQRTRDRIAPLSAHETGAVASTGRQPGALNRGALPGRGREPGMGEPDEAFRGPGRSSGMGMNMMMPGGVGLGGRMAGMPAGPGGQAAGGPQPPNRVPGGMMQGAPAGASQLQGYFLGGAAEEEENLNLVELSIYGLASLYEKYPPKKDAPPAEAAATPPTTP